MIYLLIILAILWALGGALIAANVDAIGEALDDDKANPNKKRALVFILGPIVWVTWLCIYLSTKTGSFKEWMRR